jgi:type I restriction enzyme M protein
MPIHNYVLTPGRYVGSTIAEADGTPFEERFNELKETLAEQFAEAEELGALIQKKLEDVYVVRR